MRYKYSTLKDRKEPALVWRRKPVGTTYRAIAWCLVRCVLRYASVRSYQGRVPRYRKPGRTGKGKKFYFKKEKEEEIGKTSGIA